MKKKLVYPFVILGIGCAICSFAPTEIIYEGSTDAVKSVSAESRDITTVTRKVGKFTGLKSSGSTPVTYIQSNKSEVVIEGSKEFIDDYVTEVKGETLYLHMKPGNYRYLNLRVTVYSPDLNEVEMSGSGSFTDVEGHKSYEDVEFERSGSGKFNIGKLECKEFEAKSSGSGDMSFDNLTCSDAEFEFNGSGSITVQSLTAKENLDVRLSGSGYGLFDQANIAGDLEISISGSGSVKINGKARNVNARISGSGSIMGDLDFQHIDSHTSGSGKIRF